MSRPAVVFGDVHGNSVALGKLVKMVRERFGAEVDIYSLGDLVDRGPDSKGVIDICVREGVRGILGNHELWFRYVCRGGTAGDDVWSRIMGGSSTYESYHVGFYERQRLVEAIPEAHKDFILNLPPYRVIDVGMRSFLLVHTGMSATTVAKLRRAVSEARPGVVVEDIEFVDALYKTRPEEFFWVGANVRAGDVAEFEGFTQIFGHTPQKQVVQTPYFIALDTGCATCPPYKLSAAVLHEDGTIEILTF